MLKETEIYFKNWGHYPFWDDPDTEGFNKRVKIMEEKFGRPQSPR